MTSSIDSADAAARKSGMAPTSPNAVARLSVVVGTFNRLEQIKACIESILAETRTPLILFVTDAGSTDGTVEYLASLKDPRIRPLLVGKKLGQARAYNDVFATVETDYVCWLSDDNVIVDGGLDVAVGILDREPSLGMVALKVSDVRGPFVAAPYIGGISSAGILNVNQGLLRTRVLKEVGGFSEEFRDYGIDPDLTAKVLLGGWDVAYTKQVCIHHYRNWETDKSSPEYARMRERQRAYMALYAERYGKAFSASVPYLAKRGAWKLLRDILGRRFDLNSSRRVLGLIARDWQNVMAGRYISVFDALRTRNCDYHLVQRGVRGPTRPRRPSAG
jgi:GT2 family glycosyltransferase